MVRDLNLGLGGGIVVMDNDDQLFGPADPDLLHSMFGPPDAEIFGQPADVMQGFRGDPEVDEE